MTAADPLVLARQGDPHRGHGPLALCEACGAMVRRVRVAGVGRVAAAPYQVAGNWHRPTWGYGPERQDGREPEEGPTTLLVFPLTRSSVGAIEFEGPPSSVWGYRPHARDCRPAEATADQPHQHAAAE